MEVSHSAHHEKQLHTAESPVQARAGGGNNHSSEACAVLWLRIVVPTALAAAKPRTWGSSFTALPPGALPSRERQVRAR
jgi:hypothetical protein